jgi:hypothetical protein
MDKYVTDLKEAMELLNEIDVPLLEKIVFCYTLKNLLRKYDMIK